MPRPHRSNPAPARRFTALCTLLAFLMASLGLAPSPAWLYSRLPAAGDHPCAGHGCGCSSLDHCWTACGCFTRTQRLAWSIRHNTPVPDYAEPSTDEWARAAALAMSDDRPPAPACPLCIAEDGSDHDTTQPQRGPGDRPEPPGRAATLSALGCTGIQPLITLPPIPTDPHGASALVLGPTEISVARAGPVDSPESRALEAPVPPPRPAA